MTGLDISLAEAARAVGAKDRPGWGEIRLAGVSTDSRTIRPGELFVALRGENFDGRDFVRSAFDRGASAAVVEADFRPLRGRPCLRVSDTLRALGDLAAYVRRRRPLKVMAVTGSSGKTTTKEMLVGILSRKYKTLATSGNLNNLVGLPLTLFGLRPEHETAVLEMGMNRPGEIARLTEIADPDVGLVTNVGPAHVEGLGSLRGVARAKGELFAGLNGRSMALVNRDDPLVVRASAAFGGRRLTFGFTREAEVRVRGLRTHGMRGSGFELVSPQGETSIRLSLLGRHNVANALAASAGALALGIKPTGIRSGLEKVRPFPGRLELKRLPGPVYLLDDTYNANPASTRAALEALTSIRGRGRALAVLGDMLELGPVSRAQHAGLGRAAAEMGLDLLITVGPEARAMGRAARTSGLPLGRVLWFPEAESAARWLTGRLAPHDRVLVKGSRAMGMERIVSHLEGKGRI